MSHDVIAALQGLGYIAAALVLWACWRWINEDKDDNNWKGHA